ncbi:hypothetical protein [Oleidesulfovibrio alaskensis]|jgi:hypothetical protein|uniref:hypothetical protein n=1 Tax=Oleidesulfovibrio alaskensis TaxID=58180 RepID=UPI000404622B|nr:hypothetical protein [Oleidesulfovibrio alaskensis]
MTHPAQTPGAPDSQSGPGIVEGRTVIQPVPPPLGAHRGALTERGTLTIGYRDESGTWHKDFEIRLPTMLDVEVAMAQAGEGASLAAITRHTWARTLVRIGTVTHITADMLASLADTEYGVLLAAEEALRKKLKAASATLPG